jgi:hypothetical protein
MKEHWTKTTHAAIRQRIERALSSDVSAAIAWQAAASIAWQSGYDIDPPPTTFGDRLVELRHTDGKAAGRLMLERSADLAAERGAARLYAGRRAWAKGEPQHVIDSKRTAAKQAAELESAIESRAQQQVADDAAKTLSNARKTARKDLTK